jgi:transcriptional regulator with XRE-family HTH domain
VLARRVGVCIREARRASGLAREQVARSAGLTGRELAAYERGKSVPCRSDLKALAGACGIKVHELLPADLAASLGEQPLSEDASNDLQIASDPDSKARSSD